MQITKTYNNPDGIIISPIELKQMNVKLGQKVKAGKWHPEITTKQRKFVHAYFNFCIDNGGEQSAHYDAHAFWTDAKGWLRKKYPYKEEYQEISLSSITMLLLEDIVKIIDYELIQEILEIDTSLFWKNYQDWKDSKTDLDFREWYENKIRRI